jgi:PDZ domain-containing protein
VGEVAVATGTGTVQESYVALTGALVVGGVVGGAAWLLRFLDAAFEGAQPLVLPLWAVLVPPVAAVVLWALLRRRRYPPGGQSLAIGVPVLGLALAAGVPALLPAPTPPPGTPPQVAQLPSGPVLPAAAADVVVFRDPDGSTPVTVEFADVESLNGYWAYSAGTALAPGIAAVAPGRPAQWGETISTSRDGMSTVTPTMDVELPLTAETEHTTLPLTAGMRLLYPAGGFGSFVEQDEPLTREIRVFVGAPGERAFGEELAAWRAAHAVLDRYPIGLAVVGAIGLLFTAGGLVPLLRARGRSAPPEVLGLTGMVVAEVVALPADRPDGPRALLVLGAPQPASPAERAGVRAGDALFLVGGVPVTGVEQVRRHVRAWNERRDGLPVEVLRDRQRLPLVLRG